jgi:hypothetical protein
MPEDYFGEQVAARYDELRPGTWIAFAAVDSDPFWE